MKRFIGRIECVIEPSAHKGDYGESVQVIIRCRKNDLEWSLSKIESADFLSSHFDMIFDYMKEELKCRLLEEVED
jgi:hypothetical protein